MSIVGLDLGTTFSAIAYLNELGKPQIVPNSAGERIMPSAIYFESNERVLVGQVAINSRQNDVSRSIRWIKREMGNKDFRFKVTEKVYTPAELSSYIIKKLMTDSEVIVGPKPDVLITVPANFEEAARNATMEAGKIAGFRVIGLVNEPTAAAFYYAVTNNVTGRTLIFDLGGGTFDVTVADILPNYDVHVITSNGDRTLGGYNIDQRLVDYLEKEYVREKGGTLLGSPEDRAILEDYAEEIKIQLSERDKVPYRLIGPNGRITGELSLEAFNSLIQEEMNRVRMLIDSVLKESHDSPSSIKNVVLVGGSTRLKAVRDFLKSYFKKELISTGNVDEVVALGAALYAGKRMIEEHSDEVPDSMKSVLDNIPIIVDVCNHSYGTECISFNDVTKRFESINSIIIPKNTPIPCKVEKSDYVTARDNLKSVTVKVTQGEGEDLDNVTLICEQELTLPPNTPEDSVFHITYSYDKDQRMECIFEHVDSGKRVTMHLDLNEMED